MPDIRLQEYTAKIKDMIRGVRLEEAIAHGQHILRKYPKYIEGYCLLGEACLEKELYREAIEFFQRALSADPESLISRVGLGVIYDEQGALPEAIWQLERAFELAPGNTEVRRELQRLYARHDGAERPRLRLTRGALGRLYSRNGLYARAIGEFFAVLRQDPDLPDVRVALAEAMWHEGRKLEAVEVCQELVESLPNCLKANLILGEVWIRGENEEEGQEKLNLAQELDPENRIAQEMMGRSSPLPLEEVFVSELEAMPEGLDLGATEWGLAETGVAAAVEEGLLSGAAEPGEEEGELPDWLRDMGMLDEEELTKELEAEESVLDEAHLEKTISAEEMPEWLQEVFEDSEGEETVTLPVVEAIHDEGVDTVVPDVPAAETEDQPIEAIPEWLQELVHEESPAELAEEAVEEAPVAEAPEEVVPTVEAEVVTEVVPGWEPEKAQAAEEVEEIPVMDMAAAETVAGPEAAEEEMPEWLRDLEVPFEEEASEEETPEWLREQEEPEVEEVAPPPMAEVLEEEQAPGPKASDEEMPEWLRDLGVPEAEEIIPPPVPEEEEAPSEAAVPASLLALVEAGLLDESDLESAISEMSHEALEAQRAEEVPAWLEELMENGVTPVHEEGAPVTDARLVTHEAPIDELPERLGGEGEIEEEILAGEGIAIPIVEAPTEARPSDEEVVLPIIGAPIEEAPAEEEVVLPIIGAPIEEAPPVEETAVEAFAPPVMEAPVEEEIVAPSRVDELLEELKARPRSYPARLELARQYGEEQDWTSALTHYEKLVSARKLLAEVVGDLGSLAEEGVEPTRVYQLLGDAYMQQDQLDKALEMYRLARESLTKH